MKGEATIKLKPRGEEIRGNGAKGIMELIFYKKPSFADQALKLYAIIESRHRDGNSVHVSEWRQIAQQCGLREGGYVSIMTKLRGVGMITREHSYLKPSDLFILHLQRWVEAWAYRGATLREALKTENALVTSRLPMEQSS